MRKKIPITISKSDVFPKKGSFIEKSNGQLFLTLAERSKKFLILSFARISGDAIEIQGGKLAILILSSILTCVFIFTVFGISLSLLLVLGLSLAGFGFLKNIVMEDAVRIAFSVELQPATGDVEAVETVVIAQTPKKLYRTLIFPTDK